MSKLVEIGSLKFGDWFVTPKGQRGMCLGQTIRGPFNKVYRASAVWVYIVKYGLWEHQVWNAGFNVIPLPDCTGPDWAPPETRPEIAIDTPVWVRDDVSLSWQTGHFAKWNPDGLIMVYAGGYTSHTSSKESPVLLSWNYYSLTDPNKEPEDE